MTIIDIFLAKKIKNFYNSTSFAVSTKLNDNMESLLSKYKMITIEVFLAKT